MVEGAKLSDRIDREILRDETTLVCEIDPGYSHFNFYGAWELIPHPYIILIARRQYAGGPWFGSMHVRTRRLRMGSDDGLFFAGFMYGIGPFGNFCGIGGTQTPEHCLLELIYANSRYGVLDWTVYAEHHGLFPNDAARANDPTGYLLGKLPRPMKKYIHFPHGEHYYGFLDFEMYSLLQPRTLCRWDWCFTRTLTEELKIQFAYRHQRWEE